jgi:hypothetical protein
MQPKTPHLRSTRLENLNLEPDGATLDLDGRTVNLTGDAGAPSMAALHAFHQSALADYRARPAKSSPPGWFSRLRSWLGGFFAKPNSAQAPWQSAAEPGLPRPSPAPDGAKTGSAPRQGRSEAGLSDPNSPRMQAAFADKEGVHLLWRLSDQKAPSSEVEFTCRLDSEVADKLQDCYGHLGKLGYKVTGLELLRAQPEKSVSIAKSPEAHLPPGGVEKQPSVAREKKERTMVLEVSRASTQEPVKESAPVLAAPGRILAALRAGMDSDRPAEERLTFLRGTLGKNGLKIVEVGFGEGKEHAPSRWEDASQWLARQAEPETPAKRERVAPVAEAPKNFNLLPEP